MDDGKLYLVVGGCPSCVNTAQILMRRCGFMEDRDYFLTYSHEHPDHQIFMQDPALGAHTSTFVYCKGRYINIKDIPFSEELKDKIRSLVPIDQIAPPKHPL